MRETVAAKFGAELAAIVRTALRPLEARIATLETEVKAGHARLTELERRHDT